MKKLNEDGFPGKLLWTGSQIFKITKWFLRLSSESLKKNPSANSSFRLKPEAVAWTGGGL